VHGKSSVVLMVNFFKELNGELDGSKAE